MKTRIFKLFMLPLAAFTLASAAAVSTDNSKESKVQGTTMTAYIHNPNINSCLEVTVECAPGTGLPCKDDNGWDAFGGESPVSCNIDLKRV